MQRGVGTVEKVQRSCPLAQHSTEAVSSLASAHSADSLRDSYCEIWILRRFNLRFLDICRQETLLAAFGVYSFSLEGDV